MHSDDVACNGAIQAKMESAIETRNTASGNVTNHPEIPRRLSLDLRGLLVDLAHVFANKPEDPLT